MSTGLGAACPCRNVAVRSVCAIAYLQSPVTA